MEQKTEKKVSVKTKQTKVDSTSETAVGIKTKPASPTQSSTEMLAQPDSPTQTTEMLAKADSTAQSIETQAKVDSTTKKTMVGKKKTKVVSKSETPLGVKTESDSTSENETKPDSTPQTIKTKTDSPRETLTGAKTTMQKGVTKSEEKSSEESDQVNKKLSKHISLCTFQLNTYFYINLLSKNRKMRFHYPLNIHRNPIKHISKTPH